MMRLRKIFREHFSAVIAQSVRVSSIIFFGSSNAVRNLRNDFPTKHNFDIESKKVIVRSTLSKYDNMFIRSSAKRIKTELPTKHGVLYDMELHADIPIPGLQAAFV
jgi:hypothetical protein